jgi:hypothetical protein
MAGHLCNFWWLAPDDYGKAGHKRPRGGIKSDGLRARAVAFSLRNKAKHQLAGGEYNLSIKSSSSA